METIAEIELALDLWNRLWWAANGPCALCIKGDCPNWERCRKRGIYRIY
ncbi:hypothetical protein Dalk_4604 [Desulfatibacillum aliphaticivorans]|uniref:Uncharacterized protein n=1 Tax=Desulfatibacillum aliphaticivorans TaxID=218208 RepID=B8FNK1_DESAL|nr:hypothetical protein Dalk_4604 [Desulfatibacillum aliphaticivorans]